MAEADKEQKTEQPTGKRINEARQKGQLPISREVGTWFLFIATLIVIAWLGPAMGQRLTGSLRPFLEMPQDISLEGKGLQRALANVLVQVGLATMISFALLAASVIIGTVLQTGFYFNTTKLEPNFKRLMPIHGFKRLFSSASLVELLKSFVKLVIVGMVVFSILWPLIGKLPSFVGQDLMLCMQFLHKQVIHLIVILLLVVSVIAVADLLYQRYSYFKGLRMTKQEVKDEHKQMEGDPMIKRRLMSIRLERARKRMMSHVPNADVVVTNPTHYAVALQYDNAKMPAPVVVAKGMNLIAGRIRDVAEKNAIPLISNPPLARALYDTVEVNDAIAPEHYRAVAEVISYVYKLKKKKV
ncbi:MAG: flagellar biosynthesis protein FlhB [Alphaproteobacteria bacterium]|nr:flagellar biosynthesis protein FlhB [Alphaproteobacteria bacterium]